MNKSLHEKNLNKSLQEKKVKINGDLATKESGVRKTIINVIPPSDNTAEDNAKDVGMVSKEEDVQNQRIMGFVNRHQYIPSNNARNASSHLLDVVTTKM